MTMPPLCQHLAAVHDHVSQFLSQDAVRLVINLLVTLAKDPRHLRRCAPAFTLPDMVQAGPRLEEFPPSYFHMDEHLSVVHASPALLAILDLESADALLGDHWRAFILPDEERRVMEPWLVVAQTKGGFVHLRTFITPKGRRLVLRERVWPLRDPVTSTNHGWLGCVEVVSRVLKMDAAQPSRQQSA